MLPSSGRVTRAGTSLLVSRLKAPLLLCELAWACSGSPGVPEADVIDRLRSHLFGDFVQVCLLLQALVKRWETFLPHFL